MNKNQLNEDNIISAVARVALKTQESPKTGNVYTTMTLHFKNGLEIRYFVDPKDKFGLKMLFLEFHNQIRLTTF